MLDSEALLFILKRLDSIDKRLDQMEARAECQSEYLIAIANSSNTVVDLLESVTEGEA